MQGSIGSISRSHQAALPLDLTERCLRVRRRYAEALEAARRGDYVSAERLRTAVRLLGRMLATEVRRPAETRGGLTMIDLMLMVDGLFPELRAWNQYEVLQRQRRAVSATLGVPTSRSGKAS